MVFQITEANRILIENQTTDGFKLEVGLADTDKDQSVSYEEFLRAKSSLKSFSQKSNPADKALFKTIDQYFKTNPQGKISYDRNINEIDFIDDSYDPLRFKDQLTSLDYKLAGFEKGGKCFLVDTRVVKPQFLPHHNIIGIRSARTSNDMGNFFCERVFFESIRHAMQPGSSVERLRDFHDQPLVGFFHITRDTYSSLNITDQNNYDVLKRHQFAIQSVGQGIRGYLDIIREQNPDQKEIKIALTGFGSFEDIINNPTGEFVNNAQVIRTMVEHAMLVAPTNMKIIYHDYPNHSEFVFEIDGITLKIYTKELPVSNGAFTPNGLYGFLDVTKPDAIINLGVGWNWDLGDQFRGKGQTLVRPEFKADNSNGKLNRGDVIFDPHSPEDSVVIRNGTLLYAIRKDEARRNPHVTEIPCPTE